MTYSAIMAQYLRWMPTPNEGVGGFYEVLHGELFEQRFEALRRKRPRDDGSKGRPFSGMHKVSSCVTLIRVAGPR